MGKKNKATQSLVFTKSDTEVAAIELRFIGSRETTATGGTYDIDPAGDDSSEFLLTLVGWDDTASPPAARTDTYAANTTTGATVAATIQALVDAINTDPNGFEARRLHAQSDLATTGSAAFIDVTATQIGQEWTPVLFRDESSYDGIAWSARINVKRNTGGRVDGAGQISGRGRIELLKVDSTATYASGTHTVVISEDRGSAAADEVQLFSVAGGATTVKGNIVDFTAMEYPPVFDGPLLIEQTGAAITAGTVEVLYRPLD